MEKDKALSKAQHYCAYQERSTLEVKNKLEEWGVEKDAIEMIISLLEQDNYLDESRYSKAYALGKFRMKNWGKIKIQQGLYRKGLSEKLIQIALDEIEDKEYEHKLLHLIEKKMSMQKEELLLEKKHKVSKYLISQGYEPERIWSKLGKIESTTKQ